RAWWRCVGGKAVEQVADAEILQRAAEKHRCQVALAERGEIERATGLLDDGEFLGERSRVEIGINRRDLPEVHPPADPRLWGCLGACFRSVALHQPHVARGGFHGSNEIAAAADRPGHRRGVEGERLLNFVQEIEWIAALAIHLVDEGNDRNITQPAYLEQL